MIRRLSKERFKQEDGEAIHIIALWNLMIILIPFLLLSAVFSRASILNIYLPESSPAEPVAQSAGDRPVPIISVLRDGFVVQDAERVLAVVPLIEGSHDFARLSDLLVELKRQIPGQDAIIILSEPEISYETIIHTMDASREARVDGPEARETILLFPNVSLGEVGEVSFRQGLGEAAR